MDAAGSIPTDQNGRGTYEVELPNYTFTFHDAELAPPSGACAENYGRYVHRELRQPPRHFVINVDNGGHFFIASHGIRIQAAANTMTAWLPNLWHCMSLHAGEPDPTMPIEGYCSRGLAIVTSQHPKVFRAYKEGRLSHQDALGSLMAGGALNTEEEE
ncbi:hypothetical protein NP233_g2995 [Leucocoprinus birnbaumii]|uniref:Uncharacterized protein n=1 Tax=Leucocoprinus birnbaumii TaxID=56174 RepID=A0AAD5W167_9AGAR|nr:hypothetical protein NP233_g2995 [Leucocoprinus birnbaumii]